MRVALITTTINVPKVLALYRKLGPPSNKMQYFVAADEKTPADAQMQVYSQNFLTVGYQKSLGYKSSELIGWNNDSRRNIALLEAVKWGADIIVSIDDDMIPLGLNFFERFEIMLSEPYSGLQYGAPDRWCDVGKQTLDPARQRGLPLGVPTVNTFSFVDDVQIGAMQGIILGTPDTDAGTTVASRPFVHSATDILRNGLVIHPRAKSVFNSQITAFRRELAPCFGQFYRWQFRNTDIFSSLVMRRVMRERGLHTYFGPPFGFHNRSPRDPRLDLAAELWGTSRVVAFQQWLDDYLYDYLYMSDDKTALDMTRRIYGGMSDSLLPRENIECALAFLDDMERVL